MLKIVVCIKQVPDTLNAVFDPKTGAIDRSGTENIMNPDDLHAIEMALSIKDKYGARITALTMGPLPASDVLAEAYALGVDECVLVSDRRFAGSDTLVTARILSRVLSIRGGFDIVITGVEAIDGNTSHVGFQLSEFLRIPLVAQIHEFQLENGRALIERQYGHEYQKIRVPLPLLLAVGKKINRVRIPRLSDIRCCADKPIVTVTMEDIGGSPEDYGSAGSPTVVLQTEIFSHKRGREILEGGLNDTVDTLIHKLKKHDILRY